MTISLDAAAAAMREALRETVRRYSLWYLVRGALMIIAGVLALVYPLISSTAIIYLLGWILIISGLLQGMGLIGARQVPHFWLELISVVLAIVIGVFLLRQPETGLLLFSVLLIVYLMVEGFAKVSFALTIRPFPNWGWVLASGLIGILLAIYLWANIAAASALLLGILLGILLISEGAALTYLAWQIRTGLDQP
ncbi:MAG TPA: HdeD family acid-resistance protein [Xanthobacteraceae bacterium]|nr:HdeD family acid-resistance protein [Xanthobacteraceae bacterium]